MSKLNKNNIVVKHNTVWAAERMYEAGAHFVLCTDKKTPLHRWGLSLPRKELDEALGHKARGGLLGVVPFSVGMTCLDVDEGDPSEMLTHFEPCAICPTRRDGGLHAYFWDNLGRRNSDWAAFGCYGQVRGESGYCCLWENAALQIAEALECPEQGELFPVERIGVVGQMELRSNERIRKGKNTAIGKLGSELYMVGNRHNTLYRELCTWATVRQRPADYESWKASILSKAHFENERMETPLLSREVQDTAVGVARWIWQDKKNPKTDHRSQTQRRRGRKSGRIRRQAAHQRGRKAVKMREQGRSVRGIAKELQCSVRTIQRILGRMK